jgi:hypothetical protein
VEKSNRGSDLKDDGYKRFNRNAPYMVFPAAADLISASPHRAAPFTAAVLLAACDDLHPWIGMLDLMSVGRRLASALP